MNTALDLTLEHLAAIGEALDAFDELNLDDVSCLTLRSRLEDLKVQVNGAIGAIDNRLIELVPVGQSLSVPGVGQIVVEARGKQTTHGRKLAYALAARIADKPPTNEDGEPLPPAEWCRLTADDMVDTFGLDTASTRFRSTVVKGKGLRAADFRDFEDGVPRVRFDR